MKKVKLTFIANKNITHKMLHSLYTSVRFKCDKQQVEEDFKVWSEGRAAMIVLDENKMENEQDSFVFTDHDGSVVKFKLLKKQNLEVVEKIKNNDSVSIFGLICHERKHYINENGDKNTKPLAFCVLNTMSQFKKGSKKDFLNYMTKETGLDFNEAEKNNHIVFERVVFDENDVFKGSLTEKVAIKNVIAINAEKITVVDEDKANALFYKNIGKRKSYGIGSFCIDKLNVM